jgi:excisionase family DNA binding protein
MPVSAFPHHGQAEVTAPGQLLERGEAAERLKCSQTTIRRLVQAGHLTEVMVTDSMPRILESSVDRYIAERTVRSEP